MFSLLCSLAFSKKWAVLYIGSNTYSNYRHHSNVDTVFTLLQERGFDTKNIILCQYNDIPNAASNPFKGQIFHSIEHKNVYPGASYITYSGAQVTAQKFYDILSGNDALKSTAEDDVYIYYDNHGGPGILGVPSGNGDYIKEPELVEALAQLEAKNMYRKAFFMIGACYSQSMIKNIKNKNLAIITSANDHESAYACNYDSSVGAYLTNYFNLNFDKLARENPTITLGELFETLKKVITTSETCWGGDESMKSELLSTFIGEANNNRPQILSSKQPCDAAAPLDATLRSITQVDEYKKVSKEVSETNRRFDALAKRFPSGPRASSFKREYFELIDYFQAKFGPVNPDSLGRLQLLADLAERFPVEKVKAVIDSLE